MSSNQPTGVTSVEVLVIGGGPAGATAAMLLARAGRSVMVVDKASFPRDKCCGDGLTTLALRELDALGFKPAMVPSWQTVAEAWLRSPSGREVCLPLPADGISGATAPRREFDFALLQMAREAGADVREGCTVVGVEQTGDGVDVEIEHVGQVRAVFAIAADGMWSPTRKALGLAEPGYLGEWHAFRQYATGVTGPAAHRLYVWFEPDFLPGYAWSFPLPDGRVNLGFGVVRDGERSGKSMNAEWAGLLDRPHIRAALGSDATLQDRVAAWPIPAGIDRATLSAGSVLFVGDAARATDVMTGEGIGQAIVTGRLAAEAILAGGAVAAMYEKSVRAHLLADHRMSKLLNSWLARAWIARGAVRVVGISGWTRRNFARWMFEDEPRAILLTPKRWHRKFLRRPAPFQ
ncbi:MAG: geranylgeranyl reductase family protein [Ilumatobacteraceae bacterium]